ncbi:hypothetical protein BJ138DRAFT_1168266 [Hygrophoropsis aurantiaca]|uniref:Uncharacterized protein n=1 Tax=Hygrophoropsis aurantiaca TaxID=72124 RepID=A0ACB7ZRL5_9AGAM|nr:hypothetical protein BJ138DRAFT_1168266 [Hygrophoropsis aurantiaca]
MHRSLLIEDIQHSIFTQISSKRSLNALARTCQAFTKTALDFQWRDLDEFTRLIECMPHDLWSREFKYKDSIDDHVIEGYTFTLLRPISSSDWVIFKKYSHRVRSLQGSAFMDDACILAFGLSSAPIPLLPNLKSLTWIIWSDLELLTVSRLLSPSLTTLEIELTRSPGSARQQFLPMHEIRSSLRHLAEVEDPAKNDADNVLSAIKRSLHELQNLSTIIWNELGSEGILWLVRLPALRHVTFDIPVDFAEYIELYGLEITHESGASVTTFLNYFDFQLLQNICIVSPQPSAATGTQAFYTALASSLSRESIRNISIFDEYCTATSDPAGFNPIGIHELRPLLRFDGLQNMTLGFQRSILLDDATRWHSSSCITPPAFITLLERCPKLKWVTLPLDFSTVGSQDVDFDPLSIDALRIQDRKGARAELTDLWLGPSGIPHPHAAARFLDALLPITARITMDSGWEEVLEQSFYQTIQCMATLDPRRRESLQV